MAIPSDLKGQPVPRLNVGKRTLDGVDGWSVGNTWTAWGVWSRPARGTRNSESVASHAHRDGRLTEKRHRTAQSGIGNVKFVGSP